MNGFAIRITVDTPVVLNNLLHLDGLLGRLLVSRGKNPLQVPLREVDGVFCGSAAILETGPFGGVERRIIRVKSIREQEALGRLFRGMSARQRTIGEMSPYRTQLREYPAFDCIKAVWFAGDGDGQAAFDLLEDMPSIGAMMPTGYGRVTGRKLFNLRQVSNPGILLEDGRPARAVPLPIWERLGLPKHPRAIISEQRFHPPYWKGQCAPCIAPVCFDLCGTVSEIKDMLGLA
jgi:hypothetical protein